MNIVMLLILLLFPTTASAKPLTIASGHDYGFAHIRRTPSGHIWVTYSTVSDNQMIHAYPDRYKVSKDNGETWSEERLFPFSAQLNGRNHATFESWEGCMYALDMMALLYNPRDLYQGKMYKSCDDGETWTNEIVTISMGFGIQEFVALDYTVQDNVLLALAIILRDGVWMRAILAYEEGQWNMRGEFETNYSKYRFTASTIETVKDGSLLVVMCPEGIQGLYQSRSYDGGVTWSEPEYSKGILPIIPQWSYGSYQNPDLVMLDNGVLTMSYGRPGIGLAISLDGTGEHWDQQIRLLRGYHADGSAPSPDGMNRGTSTGNGQSIALNEDTVLVAYDKKRAMPNGDHAILVEEVVVRIK